jgi:tRNA dimethylallyltransferase
MNSAPKRREIAKERVVFLVGPTATGKTRVAAILAKKINAEIISCDSMQVYKNMDILTSKPSPALRKKVAHHLINIIPLEKEYDVSQYRKEACKKIKEVLAQGMLPLVVGGTGLYISILLDGIFQVKSEDKNLRLKLFREAGQKGSAHLHQRLARVDPQAALKIHPNDTKRIIRALEVFLTTGKPISQLQKQRSGLIQEYEVKIFGLNIKRQELYRRIGGRVDKMFKAGLAAEVKSLLKKKLSRTACRAIGIREIRLFLDGGYSLKEAKDLIKRNTCLYAKRQLTWFRKDKRVKWIEIRDKETAASIANRILKKL